MANISKILVGLDLSGIDSHLIHFLKNHYKLIGDVKKLYFIHVEKNLEFPQELKEALGELPPDEEIINEMMDEIKAEVGDSFNSIAELFSVEGSPLEQLLHWSDIKNINLLVVGRKLIQDGSGIVSQKLARKSNSSILFIPPKNFKIKKIFVPVDFSEHSKIAMESAMGLATKIPGSHIVCQHVYEVPIGYHTSGKSYEQVAKIMEKHAMARLDAFLRKYKKSIIPINGVCTLSNISGYAKSIYNKARSLEADIIVMGSKGQTFSSWILLGSVAENLIQLNKKIPLYIVKKKDENFGFWKAIKQV